MYRQSSHWYLRNRSLIHLVVLITAFAWLLSALVAQLNAGQAAADAIKKNNIEVWLKISQGSKAGEFLNEKYRPCMAPTVIRGTGRGITDTIVFSDPSVCTASVLSLAERQGGSDFAKDVERLIANLPSMIGSSPEVDQKMDALLDAYGFKPDA